MTNVRCLTGLQLFWTMLTFTLGQAMFLTIAPAVAIAGNDAWLSLLLNAAVSAGLVFLTADTARHCQGRTLIGYAQCVLGPVIGRAIGAAYVLLWVVDASVIARQTADFMTATEYRQTPHWVFIFSLALVVIGLLHRRIFASLGSMALLIGPSVLILLIATLAIAATNSHWQRLLPVATLHGVGRIAQGALPAAMNTGQAVVAGMLVPFARHPLRATSAVVLGVAVAGVVLVFLAVQVVSVFGPTLPPMLWNPLFDLTRFIDMRTFVENMESSVLVFWLVSSFFRLAVFLGVAVYALTQLVPRWPVSVTLWGTGAVVAALAFVPGNILYSSELYQRFLYESGIGPALLMGVPLVLWVGARWRALR
ncbi:MAG: GerAB/ArcD/ProY family transporter [Firmicutes bacterium]|nr:GerAB/ArcD/ProY family transporter [Bacillota bacterium]